MLYVSVLGHAVETVLKGCPIGHENMVSQDRWFLVAGSVAFEIQGLPGIYVVLQDRWSLMALVSQVSLFYH